MRTLIVGDVHGCRAELEELLEKADYQTSDRLVLAGDLVNKGPDSKGVVRLAMKLGALGVRGNHDAHILKAAATGTGSQEKQKVAESLSIAELRYLEEMPFYLRFPELDDSGVIVVHAGLVPGVPLEEQEPYAMMNMRSLRTDNSPSKVFEEGRPWVPEWRGPERVVFGHDALRSLQETPHVLGLDTGCVYGNRLTAARFEPGTPGYTLFSVEAHEVWSIPH